MISKKILIATLGLSSIALYSCGGKNNNKAPVAATSEKTKEEKLIKVNFSKVISSKTTENTPVITAEISVNCGKGETSYNLTSGNENITVLSGKECSLKISEFNGYRAVDSDKPLELTLKSDGDIDQSLNHAKFTKNSETFYLNGKKVGDKLVLSQK